MLRRVISSERLDQGIFNSASDGGKACMVSCGCPCFFCWAWLIGVIFVNCINLHYVITRESDYVLEASCDGKKTAQLRDDNLHHLTGCPYTQKASKDGRTVFLAIGEYVWDPTGPCGTIAEKMEKGELLPGAPLSFIGNATGGILKAWRKDGARVCGLMEGDVGALVMLDNQKSSATFGAFLGIFMCLCLLSYAVGCAFFPDKDFDSGTVSQRSCQITLVAGLVSCVVGLLNYLYGSVGFWLSMVLVAFVVLLAYNDKFVDNLSRLGEQRQSSADAEDPSEEEPLLPNSSAQQQPSYSEPPPSSPEPQPAAEAQSQRPADAQDPPTGVVDEEAPPPAQGTSEEWSKGTGADFLMAVVLGVVVALVLGVILAFTLSSIF